MNLPAGSAGGTSRTGRLNRIWWLAPALLLVTGLALADVPQAQSPTQATRVQTSPTQEIVPGGHQAHGAGAGDAGDGAQAIPHRLDVTTGNGGLSPTRLEGEAERFYSVRVQNGGSVPQVFALVRPGRQDAVGTAFAQGVDLLGHPDVLAATGPLAPGEARIVAVAPRPEGDVPYLCLPRHLCGGAADGVVSFR